MWRGTRTTTLAVLGEKIAELEGSVNVLRNRALELEHRPLVIERVEQARAGGTGSSSNCEIGGFPKFNKALNRSNRHQAFVK